MEEIDKNIFADQYIEIINFIKEKEVNATVSYSISLPGRQEYGIVMSDDDIHKTTQREDVINNLRKWGMS